MRKVLVITHNDLDGIMSGAIAAYMLYTNDNVSVDVIPEGNPSSIKTNEILMEWIDKYDEFYILDRASATIDVSKPVYHIDHHENSSNKYTVLHSTDDSAALLTYKYLADKYRGSNIIKEYAEITSLYDTYKWTNDRESDKSKLCNELNNLIVGGSYTPPEIIELFILGTSVNEFIDSKRDVLKMLLKKQMEYIDRKYKTIEIIEFFGYKAAWCTYELYLSQIADKYLHENQNIDMFIGYNAEHPSLSFRTKKDNVDILSLARKFGGNGHTKACGCPVTIENSFFITGKFKEHRKDIDCIGFRIDDYTTPDRRHPIFNLKDDIQCSMEFIYAGEEYYCVLDVSDCLDGIKYKGFEVYGPSIIEEITSEYPTDEAINRVIELGGLDLNGNFLTTLMIYKDDVEIYFSSKEINYEQFMSLRASDVVRLANKHMKDINDSLAMIGRSK